MSRRRTTFGKLQRDRDKQAKARAKVEKRQQRSQVDDEATTEDEAPVANVDQASVLDQLAKLHEAYDEGQIDLDDFEVRRAELTSLLRIE